MFAGNFAPAGWSFCEGQLLPISENETLFQLIGTTYGGDGQSSFALPDLRGRIPIHEGSGPGLSNRLLGQTLGTETFTLDTNQIPTHSHLALVNNTNASTSSPTGNGKLNWNSPVRVISVTKLMPITTRSSPNETTCLLLTRTSGETAET